MDIEVNTQAFFIKRLFHVFNAADFKYVVLHSWQTLPDVAMSDIDMLISFDEKKRLPGLLRNAAADSGWRFVQKLWYDVPWCFYYVAVSPDGKVAVALDFVSDPKGIGEYRIKDSVLLPHREFSGLLYHLSCEMELAYKIAKRRVKGCLKESDYKFITLYYHAADINELRRCLCDLMSKRSVEEILALLKSKASQEALKDFMVRDSPAFVLFNRRWRIKFGVSWFVKTIHRVLERIISPTGCIIYLSGESIRRIGGTTAVTNREFFPPFVFRRQIVIDGRSKHLTLSRKKAALSSATLVIVEWTDRDGYDIGHGFTSARTNVCAEALTAMEARLKW